MKILNLYAGVGGNRALWGDEHEITAVEYNESVAYAYSKLYPKDEVVVEDAHEYLLKHFREFDFIWASPPCQTHSQLRCLGVYAGRSKAIYPDMKLYQEILFMQLYCKDKIWLVENVIPFYEPLVKPAFKLQRHLYWSNKIIPTEGIVFESDSIERGSNKDREKRLGIDLSPFTFKGIDKRQVLRNCVKPELGLYVFNELCKERTVR